MTTEQQSELEEIKQLISDRFDQQDEKINEIKIEIVKVESRLGQKVTETEFKLGQNMNEVESKLSQKITETEFKLSQKITETESKLGQDIVGIKVDTTWIKWLFGGLLSFILILLSVIITVIFKLIS
ncbi:MAG: hypothetical protein AAF298_18610 [Cyanobacteria bacterium P01_A01_bin.40]